MALYKPLPNPSEQIRVVTIDPGGDQVTCSLEVTELKDAQYQALSYCWGDENESKTIQMDGQEWQVTSNLYEAMKALRPTRIWIDAICINQKDDEEKSRQVAIMGEIYSKAQQTIAWIGTSINGTAEAIDFIQFIAEYDEIDSDVEYFLNDSDSCDALLDIFTRKYWSRLWIVQEFILSPDTIIQCGDLKFPSANVAAFATSELMFVLKSRMRELESNLQDLVRYFTSPFGDVSSMALVIRNFEETDRFTSIHNLLHQTQRHECKDPKDKLYALLSLAKLNGRDPALNIKPDYSATTFEIYRQFAIEYINKHKSIAVLEKAGLNRRKLPEITATWVPDLTFDGWGSVYVEEVEHDACGGMQAECLFDNDKLSTRGIKCDTVVANSHSKAGVNGRFKDVFDFVTAHEANAGETLLHLMINVESMDAIVPLTTGFCFLLGDCAAVTEGVQEAPPNNFLDWYNLYAKKWKPGTLSLAQKFEAFIEDFPCLTSLPIREWDTRDLQRHESMKFIEEFFNTTRMTKVDFTVFRTTKGYFGCSGPTTTIGDQIFVLPGGTNPFLLRDAGHEYELVDYCYIRGMMAGEMVKLFDQGQLEMQALTIK